MNLRQYADMPTLIKADNIRTKIENVEKIHHQYKQGLLTDLEYLEDLKRVLS